LSDIAVLMIAIHSALYIFRPSVARGEGGLYPYRRIAYWIWLLLPILLASLAFINGSNAYVSQGTYCFLPVRPFWYRLALGWIPRYIIFIIILGIYASIYYYVRYKFHGFTKEAKANSDNSDSGEHSEKPPRRPRLQGLPPTPVLACHGLIPDSRQNSGIPSSDEEALHSSSPVVFTSPQPLSSPVSVHRFMWQNLIATSDPSAENSPLSDRSSPDSDSFTGPITPQPLPRITTNFVTSPNPGSVVSVDRSRSRDTSWQDGFVSRLTLSRPGTAYSKRSMVDIFSILRHRPGETEAPTPVSQLQLVNSHGQDLTSSEMMKTRDKIRRQLRFLFIYPLVYIGMWILPFVNHVMQYDDRYALEPPFGLTVVTTICICSQAAIDCWLFSTREKPWRHIPDTDGGFFTSLKFWTGWNGTLNRRVKAGPGKTREEMLREARAAYRRRDEELAQRQSDAIAVGLQRNQTRTDRSWWESAGFDGALTDFTPAAVDVSNPMDAVPRDMPASPEAVHLAVYSPRVRQGVRFAEPEAAQDESNEQITKTVSKDSDSSST
jgi:G protein-coupled receptor GPR1